MNPNINYNYQSKSQQFSNSPSQADLKEIWSALQSDDLIWLDKRLSTLNLNNKVLNSVLWKLFINSKNFSKLEEKFQLLIE